MRDAWIAAKERLARKMSGQEKRTVRSVDRLPPGQRQVHNFPVLDLGIRADTSLDKWELKIHGHVENPVHARVLRRQIARVETLIHLTSATAVAAATAKK